MNVEGIGNNVTLFDTGAVRDIQENKGRCDLMPLYVVGEVIKAYQNSYIELYNISKPELTQQIFEYLNKFVYVGSTAPLYKALCNFIVLYSEESKCDNSDKIYYALLDVSFHYKMGLEKYGERNWEKGIPLHSYIDSATRHLLKWLGHFTDERHDLAFMWNILCCLHTYIFLSGAESLMDLPFFFKTTGFVDEPTFKNHLGWKSTTTQSSEDTKLND